MHFTIEKTNLLSNIQHLITVVPTKTINPILQNFLIEADENGQKVIISATNLDVTIICQLKTEVMEGGKVAVSARHLLEIVSSVDDKPIDFNYDDGYLKMQCSKAKFSLLCADYSEFPARPDINPENFQTVNAPTFAKMINIASIAVSQEETRPIFTGILWRISSEMQTVAATDGKRISEIKKAHTIDLNEPMEQVLPVKGLHFLEKVIDDNTPDLKYLFEANRVVFAYRNYCISTQVIPGKYPDYSKALLQDNPNMLVINKDTLRQAVRRVALLATDEFFKIKMKISESEIVVTSFSFEMGDAREVITDFEYQGPEFEIAFNYKFVLSVISIIETDKVKLTFADPVDGMVNNQVLIYNHPEIDDYKVDILLMPLRLQ